MIRLFELFEEINIKIPIKLLRKKKRNRRKWS